MAGFAAENGHKQQLTSTDIIGERTKHRPLYNPRKVKKLKYPASCSGKNKLQKELYNRGMAGFAAENGQKQQLTSSGERTKHRPLYNPRKVAKLYSVYRASCTGKNKKEILGEDQISRLPEDILVAILSLLTLQEAGRTSVLSRKWRYLWTFITRSLNFYDWKSVAIGARINSSTYASSVNQVLKLHQGPFVDEFIIRFCLDPHYYHDVDSWIKFAFEKGVKRFELHLSNNGYSTRLPSYKFPSMEKFRSSSNTVQGMQSYGHVTRAVGSVGFSSLTTLRLSYVNVTDEVIEYFLGNCPFLEELHVIWSRRLRNLKVVGASLKLKSLEISACIGLRVLEICAINLVSLSYNGGPIPLLLTNVPVLSKFCVNGGYCDSLMYKDHLDLSYVQQLESLKLRFFSKVFKASRSFPRGFSKLWRLKQLELDIIWAKLGDSLIIYTCLIKACPSLSRFAMRYTRGKLYEVEESSSSSSGSDEEKLNVVEEARAQASTRFQHQCLEVVELVGFIGHAKDLELASHLLEIAVSLDKLVINPCYPRFVDNPDSVMNTEALERVRKCARLLETKLPPEASLVVL